MKIIMLIFTVLLIISTYRPSNLKLLTIRKQIDYLLKSTNNDKNKTELFVFIGIIFCFIYCIILAVYIHTVIFSIIMALWIAQSCFEANIINQYIKENKEGLFLNSTMYKILSKIIDTGIFGYIIYFIVINW